MKTCAIHPAALLAIDIGTSCLKVALVDLQGKKLAEYRHTSVILSPAPGYVEQDAQTEWWLAAAEGIRHCLSCSGISPRDIAAICASGMVPNLCPLGEEGTPLRPAILYRDNRAIQEVENLSACCEERLTLQDVTPKLLWIKNKEPQLYARIKTVLNAHSYIAYKLTGNYSSDYDSAAIFGGVFDHDKKCWSEKRVLQMGLDPDMLPPLYAPTDVVGEVTPAAAAETGLWQGTPVIAGTGDSYTILVGSGVVHGQEGLIYLGTAATFLGVRRSLYDALGSCPFITEDIAFIGNTLMGGEISRWFRESFLLEKSYDVVELDALAQNIAPVCEGLFALPHLLGERTPVENPLSKGVLFGLTNAHTLAHAYRALLEGVAYVLRDSYDHADMPLKQIVVCGGGANSSLWLNIIASVLNRPLTVIPNADNTLGAAYLAGLAMGLFKNYDTIKHEWLGETRLIEPLPSWAKQYNESFLFYKELNALLQPAYAKLANLGCAKEEADK